MKIEKIAIIGAGNMGGSILTGLLGANFYPGNLFVSDPVADIEALKECYKGVNFTRDNIEACREADAIIIAVKPFKVNDVIDELKPALDYKNQTIISIAAGIGLEKLGAMLDKDGQKPPYFYVIPNTAVKVGQGMCFICHPNLSAEATECVLSLFKKFGDAMIVDEKLVNSGMALSSCGIAYIFRYIRAAAEAGVELGFRPAEAERIICQTMAGAVALLEKSGNNPEVEIDKVTTAGGLTIKGLNTLEENGFSGTVIKGIKASVKNN